MQTLQRLQCFVFYLVGVWHFWQKYLNTCVCKVLHDWCWKDVCKFMCKFRYLGGTASTRIARRPVLGWKIRAKGAGRVWWDTVRIQCSNELQKIHILEQLFRGWGSVLWWRWACHLFQTKITLRIVVELHYSIRIVQRVDVSVVVIVDGDVAVLEILLETEIWNICFLHYFYGLMNYLILQI